MLPRFRLRPVTFTQMNSKRRSNIVGAAQGAACVAAVAACLVQFTAAEAKVQPTALPNQAVEDKWAVVVGISKFEDTSLDLRFAAKDATDFAAFLEKEGAGGGNFKPDHVKLLTDITATHESIMEVLGDYWLPKLARRNDLVVIYFATHGSASGMDNEGVNYLLAHNSDTNALYATGISIQELTKKVRERVHCDRVVIIIDACHSGAAEPCPPGQTPPPSRTVGHNVDAAKLAEGTGQLVICSSQPDEASFESRVYPNGVFTHWFIEGLKSQPSLKAAFEFTRKHVYDEVENTYLRCQMPVLRSAWAGADVLLTSKPTLARKVDLKDDRDSVLSDYIADLDATLKRAWQAPAEMKQPAKVRFLVSADGSISNVTVEQSCGDKAIDVKAAALLMAASPVKRLPPEAPQKVGMNYKFLPRGVSASSTESDTTAELPNRICVVGADATANQGLDATLTDTIASALRRFTSENFSSFACKDDEQADAFSQAKQSGFKSGDAALWQRIGQKEQAKFLLVASVDRPPMKLKSGETVGKVAAVTINLISGQTGAVLESINGMLQLDKNGGAREAGSYLQDMLMLELQPMLEERLKQPGAQR